MFDAVDMAPADAILGLTEAFSRDPNPEKINLTVGVYKNSQGKTPILESVKEAEQRILKAEQTKMYVSPHSGTAEFVRCVQQMVFGADHPVVTAKQAVSAHTPGGTGALRLAGDYLKTNHPETTLWISDPTWANHAGVFQAAGLPIRKYPYYDGVTRSLAFDQMLKALTEVKEADVVVLHGCCHNPTGVDPTIAQWQQISEVLAERRAVALVDFAYQGFARDRKQDSAGLLALLEHIPELMVCSSFSKNFGLYNERVGALTVVTRSQEAAEAVLSQIKIGVRRNYSNPPAHGAIIVTTILEDPTLRAQWEDELTQMRDRIHDMRRLFAQTLSAEGVTLGPDGENAFIVRQKGMFSFSGLDPQQIQTLRDQYAIYIVRDGRVNVSGMTEQNMGRLCKAIASVA